VIIENPILNAAFAEPARHFRFDDEEITPDHQGSPSARHVSARPPDGANELHTR
jgi:hypothetical protein